MDIILIVIIGLVSLLILFTVARLAYDQGQNAGYTQGYDNGQIIGAIRAQADAADERAKQLRTINHHGR